MLSYPQLFQFPIVRRMRRRTVANRMADGRGVKWADPAGDVTEWTLRYADLSDEEIGRLQEFVAAAEGTLHDFTFLDPTANLLTWSGKLDEAVWEKGPLLAVSGGPSEWTLTNSGGGPQTIAQTIAGPAEYLYCFSVSLRTDTPTVARIFAGEKDAECAIGAAWRRVRVAHHVEAARFGAEIPAGAVVDVRGMQVEAQAGASSEQTSTRGGVYEGARLAEDALEVVTTGVNRHSCTVKIVHAIHI